MFHESQAWIESRPREVGRHLRHVRNHVDSPLLGVGTKAIWFQTGTNFPIKGGTTSGIDGVQPVVTFM